MKSYSEFVKIQLSTLDDSDLHVSALTNTQGGTIHVTKVQFLEVTKVLLDRTMAPVNVAITESGLTSGQIGKVVLAGGSTKLPMASEYLQTTCGAQLDGDVNPQEVVGLGAASQGAV